MKQPSIPQKLTIRELIAKLSRKRLELQKELHIYIANFQGNSNLFWNKHEEISKVQWRIYGLTRKLHSRMLVGNKEKRKEGKKR
jgi:hypothetical protein